MTQKTASLPRMYDGDGDRLMRSRQPDAPDQLVLIPDALPSKTPESMRRIRIMWGQHLLEDLLAGRYRTLVCAVNAENNSSGIITQLAHLLPTSQWDEASITTYAQHFSEGNDRVKVLKYDMDLVEVLAILRPPQRKQLTVDDLGSAFEVVSRMVRSKPGRTPSASVSFLGARANILVDRQGGEPSFESVLHAMYEAGYMGDVYPSPAMWHCAPVGVYPRYPFSQTLDSLRQGGF